MLLKAVPRCTGFYRERKGAGWAFQVAWEGRWEILYIFKSLFIFPALKYKLNSVLVYLLKPVLGMLSEQVVFCDLCHKYDVRYPLESTKEYS